MGHKPVVFLDASVIITALLSDRGGSFYVLSHGRDSFAWQTNEYVLEEVQRVLRDKFPEQPNLLTRLFLLLGTSGVIVLPLPEPGLVARTAKYISRSDAPILASALHFSDYLLTLDNDFFTPRVLAAASKASLTILKPGDLLQLFNKRSI